MECGGTACGVGGAACGVGGAACGVGGAMYRVTGSLFSVLIRIGELLCALKQLDAQTVHDAQTPDNHEDKESSSDTQESDGRGSEECVGVDVKHLSVTPPGWNAPLLKGDCSCPVALD